MKKGKLVYDIQKHQQYIVDVFFMYLYIKKEIKNIVSVCIKITIKSLARLVRIRVTLLCVIF